MLQLDMLLQLNKSTLSWFWANQSLLFLLNAEWLVSPDQFLILWSSGFEDSILYIYFPCIREIWRFVHPWKVIFPPRAIWLFRGWTNFISPLCKGNKCFIPPGQQFGEFCQMKSFGQLCLQNYYFGTSLELSLLTWPKR
jgi:hypothetical protein